MPTIHSKDTFRPTHETPRSAFHKRERARVLEEILKDKFEDDIQDTEGDNNKKDWVADTTHGNKISRATQTDQLYLQKSLSKFTQTKKVKQDDS